MSTPSPAACRWQRFLRPLVLIVITALGLSLAACSSDDNDDIIIEHAYGTTEIPADPERIATVNWSNEEVPLALGVVPVGMAKANFDGSDLLPWTQEKLEELGATGDKAPVLFDETEGVDFEAVADTEPDVILAAYSGLTEEDYDRLSEIAPTVPFPKGQIAWGTTWRESIEIGSKAMGMEDEGNALLADLEQQIEERSAEYPDISDKKTMFLTYVDPDDLSQVAFYSTHDARSQFLTDLGMGTPDAIREWSEENDEFVGVLSAEQSDDFDDVDIIVTYGDEETLEALQNDPVFGQIPAVRDGAVVLLSADEPLGVAANPTPLAIPYILDDYLKALDEAAAKVE